MKYLLLLFIPCIHAAEFGLEIGQSSSFLANPSGYTDSKYSAITYRYKYLEAIEGGWVGGSSARFTGLSGAYRTSGKEYLDFTVGGVRLINYSGSQLDGINQFAFSIGIGKKVDNLNYILKYRHFSNGKRFKGSDNSLNKGQDFLTFEVKY